MSTDYLKLPYVALENSRTYKINKTMWFENHLKRLHLQRNLMPNKSLKIQILFEIVQINLEIRIDF